MDYSKHDLRLPLFNQVSATIGLSTRRGDISRLLYERTEEEERKGGRKFEPYYIYFLKLRFYVHLARISGVELRLTTKEQRGRD